MKVKIVLKDPDGVYNSIRRAANDVIEDKSNYQSLIEEKQEEISELCSKWIDYGEYVTIEIDTETGTAKVCETE